jgi:hypothetical protein
MFDRPQTKPKDPSQFARKVYVQLWTGHVEVPLPLWEREVDLTRAIQDHNPQSRLITTVEVNAAGHAVITIPEGETKELSLVSHLHYYKDKAANKYRNDDIYRINDGIDATPIAYSGKAYSTEMKELLLPREEVRLYREAIGLQQMRRRQLVLLAVLLLLSGLTAWLTVRKLNHRRPA